MALRTSALLSVGFFLLLTRGALTDTDEGSLSIKLSVENEQSNEPLKSYSSSVVKGGVLLGALRRLHDAQHDFKFTVKEDPNFGLFLESVNGVAGNKDEKTYWEILSESSGEFDRLDVGIGCYMPKADEHIVLRYTTWSPQQ
ncbi:cobalamin binding intrinsic factor-like isoform X1 [Maylandia zebra]|uniref:Uncharacterized protein n=4 Tax=Haplochromini TaxID=319058 RepID=A0A3Q2W8D5_HAPBU